MPRSMNRLNNPALVQQPFPVFGQFVVILFRDVARLIPRIVPGNTVTDTQFRSVVVRSVGQAAVNQASVTANKRRQTRIQDSSVNYTRALTAMKRHRYRGYISLEFEYHDVDLGNEVDVLSEIILLRDFFLGRAKK